MKNNFINDAAFMLALKKGESKAYSHLVDMYHKRLCTYAYGLIRDSDLAEDIVQNVFMKIWRKRKKLKEDLNITNYLYKSVYNGFVEQYRKKRPVFSLEKVHIESLNIFVQEDGKSLEKIINYVKKEIENLPPKCKQTFLLSKQEGLTNIEIANYLNVSVKTVEGHITKAFGILRKNLDGKMHRILFLLFGMDKKTNSPLEHSFSI